MWLKRNKSISACFYVNASLTSATLWSNGLDADVKQKLCNAVKYRFKFRLNM